LTSEGGYIAALLVGLLIANFFPRFAAWLNEAIRPELYIKIAIVILAITAAGKLNLASSVFLRGIAAIAEAYLIYWAVVYYVARKYFGFSRERAAPLASGISICGVAASIATGGAIRARPQVAVLVSSLVVVFAVIEVLILPFVAQTFLPRTSRRGVLDRPLGQDRRRRGRRGRHHRIIDPRQKRRRRDSLSARLGFSERRRRSKSSSTYSSASGPFFWPISGRPTSM
jgi:hypothetical protein